MLGKVESWIAEQIDAAASPQAVNGEPRQVRHVYAIVDASRQPMVIPVALDAFASRVSCLFSGNARNEFGDNAAWVVELRQGEGAMKWLLDQGFSKRWSIFAKSHLEMEPFVRHLKKFTVSTGEDGRTFFFRFYDPHVLRQYLPMFDERQKELFFKEIREVFLEDTSGRHVLIGYDLTEDGHLNMTPLI